MFCEHIGTYFFLEVVHQLEMTASYETSFRCSDGSYALISGDNLTLVYDYGYKYSQVRMTLTAILCYAL